MRPLGNNALIKKCEAETEQLFQFFLNVAEEPQKYQETDEGKNSNLFTYVEND